MLTWQPTSAIDTLRKRAAIITTIRQFFAKRDVLEVETPILSHATVTDPYVLSIPAFFKEHGADQTTQVYLQTSPEYAMKRLLAAGSGSIYQMTKSFRQGDLGRYHNPEFTMLEWYRVGFDHHALMQEVADLLREILLIDTVEKISYAELFKKFIDIDPHTVTINTLKECVGRLLQIQDVDSLDYNTCLDLLMTHHIEPFVGQEIPIFVYDFPVSKAALAKIRAEENPPVASRFEVYFKGVELANGFHELQNANEQRLRFENDLQFRQENGIPSVPMDERFLMALQAGIPDCSGVALGIDRLLMLALKKNSIKEVIGFDFTVS